MHNLIYLFLLEGVYEIYPLLGKRPRVSNNCKLLGWMPLNDRETLTLVTFLHKINYILFQGRLIIPLSKHLLCKDGFSNMVATYTSMIFPKDVVCFLSPCTSKKRRWKASLINNIISKDEMCISSSSFIGFILIVEYDLVVEEVYGWLHPGWGAFYPHHFFTLWDSESCKVINRIYL